MVIHNYPYYGASHSPDLCIVVPVFWRGELVGFTTNTAHHVDISAATPGLIIDIPDVFAEGMLFAGVKLYERGKRNDGLWQFIGYNSRTARQTKDDNQLMDYTETMMRNCIAEIPDGSVRPMPAKFSNVALQAGEAMAYYAPCGGSYGE